MSEIIILVICIFIFFEFFLGSIAILARKTGVSHWYLALIPLYGFKYLSKVAGEYKVLTIPVKKSFGFILEITFVLSCCLGYLIWGYYNLVTKAFVMQKQIMLVPIVVCITLYYLGIIKSSFKLYERFNVNNRIKIQLLSLIIIPIPIVLFLNRNNPVKKLQDIHI